MTRSEVSEHSPRVVRKAAGFRAQACAQGLTYPQAITAAKARAATTSIGAKLEGAPVNGGSRNPGQMDGVQWNGDSFVCANIDGEVARLYQVQELRVWDAVNEREKWGVQDHNTEWEDEQYTVLLVEVARPAKRKGVGKKHEVIPTTRRVVNMETASDGESELWEQWVSWIEACRRPSESWWELPACGYTEAEWEELYTDRVES